MSELKDGWMEYSMKCWMIDRWMNGRATERQMNGYMGGSQSLGETSTFVSI